MADHTVSLHMGLMTISPVMGTALIRSVMLEKGAPRGPLLTLTGVKQVHLNKWGSPQGQTCGRPRLSFPGFYSPRARGRRGPLTLSRVRSPLNSMRGGLGMPLSLAAYA